jgi:ATP-dependent DNA helicase RecQ
MVDLAAATHLLRTVFGFAAFREGQAEIIEQILAGREVLAVMPTGSGKSLCYQLPALVDAGQNRDAIEQIQRGELRLVYVAPERLAKGETIALLKRAKLGLLAVDEAQCISQWGHDFRPEYLALSSLHERLGGIQTVAFTATADAATRADIAARLFRGTPQVFVHGFDRPNLNLAMSARSRGSTQLLGFIARHRDHSGIVYCATRRLTEELRRFCARTASRRCITMLGWTPQTAPATRTRSCARTASSWSRPSRPEWA